MLGTGLFPKAKQLLPITAFLFFIFWRGAFISKTLCGNINVLLLRVGDKAQCTSTPDRLESDVRSEKTMLIWLQGYNLWTAGDYDQAVAVWQKAPEYAATMLTTWVQNGGLTEADVRARALTQALLLDPNTPEISEMASFYLFEGRQWQTAYAAFMVVTKSAPENAVAKAALALAGLHLDPPDDEVLELYDMSIAKSPKNLYVLRYGLRLMQAMPSFGEKRTAHLAALAAEQLPQDFEFTFGVASAFRNLSDLKTAGYYNLMALSINPIHPWANLQQIELIQLLEGGQVLEPWLQQAIDGRVKDRPDYYHRLLIVLVKAGAFQATENMYCDGLVQGFSSEMLLQFLDNDTYIRLKKANCHPSR